MLEKGIYEHYKGKKYELIGLAKHSETLEDLVVYKALYHSEDFGDETLWVRPKTMFEEEVYLNGEYVPRFRYLGEYIDK